MPVQNGKEESRFKLGDRVKIRLSNGMKGRIVELRGPLGPGGAHIFRIQFRKKPEPGFIEVREDQLVLLKARAEPTTDAAGG